MASCGTIFDAAKKGDALSSIIKASTNVNTTDANGCSALAYAAVQGSTENIKTLLDAKADVELADKCNRNPLMYATAHGKVDSTKALLNAKADIDSQDDLGMTPLTHAIAKGHTETVTALLAAKASFAIADQRGRTPLMYAVVNGTKDIVKMLLDAKANVSARDQDQNTALMHARASREREIEALLQEHILAQVKPPVDTSPQISRTSQPTLFASPPTRTPVFGTPTTSPQPATNGWQSFSQGFQFSRDSLRSPSNPSGHDPTPVRLGLGQQNLTHGSIFGASSAYLSPDWSTSSFGGRQPAANLFTALEGSMHSQQSPHTNPFATPGVRASEPTATNTSSRPQSGMFGNIGNSTASSAAVNRFPSTSTNAGAVARPTTTTNSQSAPTRNTNNAPNAARTANPKFVKQTPSTIISTKPTQAQAAPAADTNVDDDNNCVVCYEVLQKKQRLQILGCGHKFHHTCIEEWFKMNPRNQTCPMCRDKVV